TPPLHHGRSGADGKVKVLEIPHLHTRSFAARWRYVGDPRRKYAHVRFPVCWIIQQRKNHTMSSRSIRPFCGVIVLLALRPAMQARQGPALEIILKTTGEKVERYAGNLLNIVCTETSVQQELDSNGEPAKTKPTELVYDFMTVPRGGGPALSEQ